MINKIVLFLCCSFITILSSQAVAVDKIRIVGSSTLYPFISIAAEKFGKYNDFGTPIIESTGTGAGVRLFCLGEGDLYPDIVTASRSIQIKEKEFCAQNGNKEIAEFKFGYDGIVLANSTKAIMLDLELKDIFLALAKQVPFEGKLIDNQYISWKQLNPNLPDLKIQIYGPPVTSGTRASLVELVMIDYCVGLDEFIDAYPNLERRTQACGLIRDDGLFIESGENENLIIQKLSLHTDMMGIFGYNFLKQSRHLVHAANINGIAPELNTIKEGLYPLSRPLYLYVKSAAIKQNDRLKLFLQEVFSSEATGSNGYLVRKGLVPLSAAEIDINNQLIISLSK